MASEEPMSEATNANAARNAASALIGGGRHTFTVTVNVRGHGANWSSDMAPQQVSAYSLSEALRLAAEIPLGEWFPWTEEDR